MNFLSHYCRFWPLRRYGCQHLHRSTLAGLICRNSTTGASQYQNAQDIIKKQLEFNLELPKAKTWSDTAVLEALSSTVGSDINFSFQHLESPEYWHSSILFNEDKRHQLRMRGRATANYVIQNYEHLFQHKWSVDSIDTWIDLEDEEIPALHLADGSRASIESGDTELSSDMDTVEKFRTLVEQKKVDEAIKLYHMLCREEKELPQDLVNHFLGLCAFYKGSSSQVELLDWDPCKAIYFNCIETGPAFSSRFVYEIYESLPDSTIDTLSAKILSFPNTTKRDAATAVEIFNSEVKEDMKLDISVYNYILLCLRNTESSVPVWKTCRDVFNSMKRHNVKPNYETFVLFSHLTLFGIHASPQRMVEHFSKILLEMKELGIAPGLSIFASMIATASKFKQVQRAVLNFMDGKQFQCQHPLDISAFYRMMTACRRNVDLLKKLLKISQHGSNSLMLSSNRIKSFGFYTCILLNLLEKDTVENLFTYFQMLSPAKIVVDIGFIQKVVERLQSEKRPEFLPLLMIYFPPTKYYDLFEQWLKVAIEQMSSADESTKVQFRHISIIELRNCYRMQNEKKFDNVINLCLDLLISTAENFTDVADIFDALAMLRKPAVINENIFERVKKFGIEQNRSAHADRIIYNLRKKIG